MQPRIVEVWEGVLKKNDLRVRQLRARGRSRHKAWVGREAARMARDLHPGSGRALRGRHRAARRGTTTPNSLYVANEGKLVAFVPPEGADATLATMRAHPLGRDAVRVGTVTADHVGLVVLRTEIGGSRILERPYGELLPRIC
jgi:hypothetical protein